MIFCRDSTFRLSFEWLNLFILWVNSQIQTDFETEKFQEYFCQPWLLTIGNIPRRPLEIACPSFRLRVPETLGHLSDASVKTNQFQ